MKYELKNISISFGEKQVLDHFSLELEQGSVCCLMGASGIGKTTLLRIMMGLERADEEEKNDFRNLETSAVFQEDRLLEFADARNNIRMAAAGKNLLFQPEQVLDGLLEKDEWGKPVSALSGGMRRRAAIARALAVRSELILMDEPFAGLDEETRKKTIERILTCREGRTLLVVTHGEEDYRLLGAERRSIQ